MSAQRYEYTTDVLLKPTEWDTALAVRARAGWRAHTASWPTREVMVVLWERPVGDRREARVTQDEGRGRIEAEDDPFRT